VPLIRGGKIIIKSIAYGGFLASHGVTVKILAKRGSVIGKTLPLLLAEKAK
jgi:hypothetical protein